MARAVDDDYLGKDEPTPQDKELETNSVIYTKAFSWYNYFYNPVKYKKSLMEYANRYCTKTEIDILDKVPDYRLMPVHYAIAKMFLRGWVLPQKFKDTLHDKIKNVVDNYKEVVVVQKPVVNVVDRAKERQRLIIANFELELDAFFENYTTKFSPYEYLNKMQIPPAHATAVGEYYEKLLKELYSIDTNEDVKYAHRNLSKKQFKSYVAFVELIVNDANRWANNKKQAVTRAPRKVQEKTPDKIVKYLKYKTDFPELKLVSVDPKSIIKSSSLWVYNVKYKYLTVYHALEGGLTVEGTTIKNFNPQLSVGKTLRNPQATLTTLISAGKVGIKTLMGTLTTKAWVPNGRVNADTILVRVIK